MGVLIESTVWEPNASFYIFLFFCCIFSIFLFPYSSNSNRTSTAFDHGISSSSVRFQRSFLLVYSLASGLWSVFGGFELASQGIVRELMVISLCYGYASAFFASPFLGVLSDLMRNISYPSTTAILAKTCIAFLARGRKETPQSASSKEYSMSFHAYIFLAPFYLYIAVQFYNGDLANQIIIQNCFLIGIGVKFLVLPKRT